MNEQLLPDPAQLAAASAHLERLPLGDAVIVHNRASGAITATNAFGALLLDNLPTGTGDGDITHRVAAALDVPRDEVQAAVTGTLARWAADGLFLTAQRPFPMCLPHREPVDAVQRDWTRDGHTIRLACEDADLAEDLDRALAPLDLEPTAVATTPIQLDVLTDGEGYHVYRDHAPIWGIATRELTRFHLLREIMDVLCGATGIAAHLHASALERGGAGLVFAGASGSGKSTLATLLLGQGAALVADDHVALDVTGEALCAFPTRPNLKPGTAGLPRVEAVIRAENASPDAAQFVPRARVPVGTRVPLAALVFPRYRADGDNALDPLAPDAALRELIQTGSRVSRGHATIAPLVHALASRPVYRLRYADTDFAIAQCLTLFGT